MVSDISSIVVVRNLLQGFKELFKRKEKGRVQSLLYCRAVEHF